VRLINKYRNVKHNRQNADGKERDPIAPPLAIPASALEDCYKRYDADHNRYHLEHITH